MKQKNEEVENGKTRVKYKNLETPVHYSTRVHKVLSYFQLLQQWFCYWSVPMAAERPDHLCRWLWGDAWHHSCLQRLTSRPDPTRPDLRSWRHTHVTMVTACRGRCALRTWVKMKGRSLEESGEGPEIRVRTSSTYWAEHTTQTDRRSHPAFHNSRRS